jgi:hypothetical protein
MLAVLTVVFLVVFLSVLNNARHLPYPTIPLNACGCADEQSDVEHPGDTVMAA